jgi:RNA recognition motif-containing protein
VEYATREQAQNAVATLSNQNLMGRLVYVREDREAEPRFSNPTTTRGGFEGAPSMRGGGQGFQQPFGGPQGGPPGGGGGGGRQVYVANVCSPFPSVVIL